MNIIRNRNGAKIEYGAISSMFPMLQGVTKIPDGIHIDVNIVQEQWDTRMGSIAMLAAVVAVRATVATAATVCNGCVGDMAL